MTLGVAVRLDLARILLARTQISPLFLDTPQYECEPLSESLGCRLLLKVETLNPVRSFKGRGTETVLTVFKKEKLRTPSSARVRGTSVRRSLSAAGCVESESRLSHRRQPTR
jgi:threonine dehydratase